MEFPQKANPVSPRTGNGVRFRKSQTCCSYTSSGTYFARVKRHGKIIRQSLDTDVWTNAKLRLADFLKEKQNQLANKPEFPRFREAVERFKQDVANDASLKERSKHYRTICIWKLELSRPELWEKCINEIKVTECKGWAAKLRTGIAGQYFNNVVDTLRLILDAAIDEHEKSGGERIQNPAREVARAKIKPIHLKLPGPDQFQELVAWVRKQNASLINSHAVKSLAE